MNKKDFMLGMGEIDERFIAEASASDNVEKTARRSAFIRRPAVLVAAILTLVALSVTAVAAIVPLVVPEIPAEAIESLNIRPTNAEEREAAFKQILREQLEESRKLYGEENFTVSDEEVDAAYDELYQNSVQKLIAEASGGAIKRYHYDTTIPDLNDGKIYEGTGYFYEGYLPVIYIEITKNGETDYTFGYDATLAKYGAFASLTQNADGTYELGFIDVGDALDKIIEVAGETLTPGVNIKNADGTYDYAAFYNALVSKLHREYFAIIFERAGIKY